MEEERVIQFVFTPPLFGNKNELASLNNHTKWAKFAQTKMKQEFKEVISDWSLPPWEDNPFLTAELEFTILRTNKKKFDNINFAYAYKWLEDLLVENNYLLDDDQNKIVLNPTQLDVEGSVETSISVVITLYERFEMTIDELKAKVTQLNLELENVGEDTHVKAASGRVRSLLGEIKNATPQLRRDLIALDKK